LDKSERATQVSVRDSAKSYNLVELFQRLYYSNR